MRRYCRGGAAILFLGANACGGGSPAPGGPSPSPSEYRVTITAEGVVSPAEIVVPAGAQVLFTNNHSRRHDMTSDDHPDHLECPPINDVGLLNPGQSRETGNLIAVRTCGYHDHENPDVSGLKGRIIVR